MSTRPVIQRRASYGPSSPDVGERGARTRQRIVDVALQLFATCGVHSTSVDDIAKAAKISRATLYQYFESKEQIFLELVQESGAALQSVIDELGPLGPDRVGFENLRRWVTECDRLYTRYATTFVQWASVNIPRAPLRPMIDSWISTYQTNLAARFSEMPIAGVAADDLAAATWSIFERYSYYRHTRGSTLDIPDAVDNLAVVLQLLLFPSTPSRALIEVLGPYATSSPRTNGRRVVVAPSDEWRPDRERFAQLSHQSMRTVRQLLDAGGRLFGANGYHQCSVDQIVVEAGFARGTFYKYFEDKQDLLVTLSRECAETVIRTTERFAEIRPGAEGAHELHEWLTHHVALHRDHSGIFRMWIEQAPDQPELEAAAHTASTAALLSFAAMLRRLSRAYPLDPVAAALMLHGLIEAFPERRPGPRDDPDLVDLMMRVIERGFLNPGVVERS